MRGFWSAVALGDIRHERIAGDHLSCLQPPHVDAVAASLVTGGQAA
jgi:thioesterase domain-containing protein